MHHRLLNQISLPIIIFITLFINFFGLDIPLIRVISGLALVLVLPGYSLTMVLFPGRDLSQVGRVAFSLGLSMAISSLAGIILSLSPWGLNTWSWMVLLGAISLIFSIVGIFQRRNRIEKSTIKCTVSKLNLAQAGLLTFGVILFALAIIFVRVGETKQVRPGFTQLWGIPDSETSVRIGIQNYEQFGAKYRLHILRDEIEILDQIVELNSGEIWETIVNLPSDPKNMWIVEANLYLLDEPDEIYRRILLSKQIDG